MNRSAMLVGCLVLLVAFLTQMPSSGQVITGELSLSPERRTIERSVYVAPYKDYRVELDIDELSPIGKGMVKISAGFLTRRESGAPHSRLSPAAR